MSDNAKDYADSLAQSITDRTDSGYPFGVLNEENGETLSDIEEAHDSTPEDERDNLTEASAYDYLEGVLDINYIINADRTYKGARILIAFGGPTAWIDTNTGQLEAAWWSATEYRNLPSEFINGLDDALEELYGC